MTFAEEALPRVLGSKYCGSIDDWSTICNDKVYYWEQSLAATASTVLVLVLEASAVFLFTVRFTRVIDVVLTTQQLWKFALRTETFIFPCELRAGTTVLIYTLIFSIHRLGRTARARDCSGVTKVTINADVIGSNAKSTSVLDDDLAGGLRRIVGAVAARAI